jgi:GNAT superfamily N-acetyltransferase
MKYRGIQPYIEDDISIGIEKMSEILDEIAPLHKAHYAETEEAYLDDPYDPDYVRLFSLEENGGYVVFTVRKNMELVGYIQYYVFRDLHTQRVYTAREDCLYIKPEARGLGLAPRLLNFAEHGLRQLNCKYVGMTSKSPVGGPDIRPFLEKRGYRMVAEYFSKKLED